MNDRLRVWAGMLAMTLGAVVLVILLLTREQRAVTEDSAGWDCLRQGNVTCRIDGVLVTSLEGMPSDPYGRCDFLLGISERVGGIGYADELCSPIAGQRG